MFLHLQGRLQKTCWAPYCVSGQVRFYWTPTAPPSLKPQVKPGAWRSFPVTLVGLHSFWTDIWVFIFYILLSKRRVFICHNVIVSAVVSYYSPLNMYVHLFHIYFCLHVTNLYRCKLKKNKTAFFYRNCRCFPNCRRSNCLPTVCLCFVRNVQDVIFSVICFLNNLK